MNKKISFSLLYEIYQKEESYIGATIKYVDSILDIDINEFNIKDLPNEWILCLEREARENNLIRKNNDKNSFMHFFKDRDE